MSVEEPKTPQEPAAEQKADEPNALDGITLEVAYNIDNGIFAFEGVSPNITEAEADAIEVRLREVFDQVRRMWFTNALGLRSVFWRAWCDRLHFESITLDGKIVAGAIPIGAVPWKECGAMESQRPKGFTLKAKGGEQNHG
ncbi:MAG TPA: hypothetical protein VGK74_02475 [Symbiobacteriaceae bacterium]|jgi:hypothetical protein